jgi:hypothetical protein
MTTKSPLIVCLESSQNLLKGIERFQRANPDIVQLKTDLEATVKNLEFLQLQQVSGHVDELTDLSVTLLNCAVGIQSLAITTDFRNASLQNEIGRYSDEIAIFILRKYGYVSRPRLLILGLQNVV